MEFRNVLMAIVLSTLVLVLWYTFFETPPVERQLVENQKIEYSTEPQRIIFH